MDKLTHLDLLTPDDYEQGRDDYRAWIIEMKKERRISVGDRISLVFENRETVRFQIQEIMRAERIDQVGRIQEELDTYNDLIPVPDALVATLFIEVTDQSELRKELDRFQGIDRGGTTFLIIGEDYVEGEFEGGRSSESKISAVHYVNFKLTPDISTRMISGLVPVSVLITHGSYHHQVYLTDASRSSLIADLRQI
jgi:hypothetical protein